MSNGKCGCTNNGQWITKVCRKTVVIPSSHGPWYSSTVGEIVYYYHGNTLVWVEYK